MKLFECQHCGQPLYFENTHCESCGRELGYLASRSTMTALEKDRDESRALAEPKGRYRYCANVEHGMCNWLVPSGGELFCEACRHNRMIPDLTIPGNAEHWRQIEFAKHRLFYSLLKFKLPLANKNDDPNGLAFDFLSDDANASVMTGHADGLITLNLAEADDAERERRRHNMGEPYRTLLGHFRHEIAHYYWDGLVSGTPALDEYRTIFGDERQDYGEALQRHYQNGAPNDWPEHFVSSYASSHPWEDWAETFAHYFHMVDTLETASSFGMQVKPRVKKGAELATTINFDPYATTMERLIEAWLPLTFAMNSINRSMGQPDLYPFVLSSAVIVKLSFVHARIHAHDATSRTGANPVLRAMVAGLKRSVGLPQTG